MRFFFDIISCVFIGGESMNFNKFKFTSDDPRIKKVAEYATLLIMEK